jgi:hypothetical protein
MFLFILVRAYIEGLLKHEPLLFLFVSFFGFQGEQI